MRDHPQRRQGAAGQGERPQLLRQPARQAALGRPATGPSDGGLRTETGGGSERRIPDRGAGARRRSAAPGAGRGGCAAGWCAPSSGALLLLAVALLAGSLLSPEPARARAARRPLVAAVSEFLGRKIQVGDLDYTFFPPAVELRDVVIPGPRPGDPPVARVPFVRSSRPRATCAAGSSTWSRSRSIPPADLPPVQPRRHRATCRGSASAGPRPTALRGADRPHPGAGRHSAPQRAQAAAHPRRPGRLGSPHGPGRARRRGRQPPRRPGHRPGGGHHPAAGARPTALTVSAKGSLVPEEGRIRIAAARLAGPDLQAGSDGFVDYRSREPARSSSASTARAPPSCSTALGYMEEPIAGPFASTAASLRAGRRRGRGATRGTATLAPHRHARPRLRATSRRGSPATATACEVGHRARPATPAAGPGADRRWTRRRSGRRRPGRARPRSSPASPSATLIARPVPGRGAARSWAASPARAGGTLGYRFTTRRALAGSGRGRRPRAGRPSEPGCRSPADAAHHPRPRRDLQRRHPPDRARRRT